jgi:hypothetical protein
VNGGDGAPESVSTSTSAFLSAWTPIATPTPSLFAEAALTTWATNRLDLFYTSKAHELMHRWSLDGGATWNGDEHRGGWLKTPPAAVSWGPNRIDVVVIGSDDQLYHQWWDGSGWYGWEPLGGSAGHVAISSAHPGELDVEYVELSTNVTKHFYYWGGWSGTENLGGYSITPVRSASWSSTRLDIITDTFLGGGLSHRAYDAAIGGWAAWDAIPNVNNTALYTISSYAPSELDVFWIDAGHRLRRETFAGSGWVPETDLGPTPGRGMSITAATLRGSSRVDLVTYGFDTGLFYHAFVSDPVAPGCHSSFAMCCGEGTTIYRTGCSYADAVSGALNPPGPHCLSAPISRGACGKPAGCTYQCYDFCCVDSGMTATGCGCAQDDAENAAKAAVPGCTTWSDDICSF